MHIQEDILECSIPLVYLGCLPRRHLLPPRICSASQATCATAQTHVLVLLEQDSTHRSCLTLTEGSEPGTSRDIAPKPLRRDVICSPHPTGLAVCDT